jgi:hypothetical protein
LLVYIIIISFFLSVEHAAFVSGDHVLDVDERIFSSMDLKHLKCLLDQVAQVHSFPLAVVYLVPQVLVLDFEEVQHRQDLSVVRHQCFSNGV